MDSSEDESSGTPSILADDASEDEYLPSFSEVSSEEGKSLFIYFFIKIYCNYMMLLYHLVHKKHVVQVLFHKTPLLFTIE